MNFRAAARALHTALAFVFDDDRIAALENALREAYNAGHDAGFKASHELACASLQARIREVEEENRLLHYGATRNEDQRRTGVYR